MGCEKLSTDKVAELVVPNQHYISEAKKLDERWSKTKFLNGIDDKFKRLGMAVILENQRLMNEASTGQEGDAFNEAKAKLVELAAAVYPKLLAWKLISMQPMLGPTGLVYAFRYKKSPVNDENMLSIDSEDVCARTRKLNRRVAADYGPNDASKDVVEEFDTEVLKDLWNNCAVVGSVNLKNYKTDKAIRLEEKITEVLDEHSKKIGHGDGVIKSNWIVVNDKLHKRLDAAFNNLKNVSIYPHKGVEGVLIGYKGDSYMDSGYAYSPYVPFTLTPCFDGLGTFGLLTRYGKKLLRDGFKYYSRVTVFDDVPDEE